jgi:hypothetical protein
MRISDCAIAAAFLAAALAGCASPEPPPTAHAQQQADLCRKYDSPTDFGRCRLFLSADGWRWIPEIGRNADLDTQIRCAPYRPDLNAYAQCIGRARAAMVTRDAAPAHVQQHSDPCSKYSSPADFGLCRLFLSAEGSRFIPEIGRTADIDTQIRCAPIGGDLDAYAKCITGSPLTVAALRDGATAGRPAGLTSRAPVRVEPIATGVAAPSPAYNSASLEDTDPAWTSRTPVRGEPTAPRVAAAGPSPAYSSGSLEDTDPAWTTRTPPRAEPAPPPAIARVVPPAPETPTAAPSVASQPALAAVSDETIRQAIIRQSIGLYGGSCPCPYNVDRGGRRCGGRSAYSRPGGASPYCYPDDVPAALVAQHREILAAQ